MKKVFLALAFSGLSTAALAADLPSRAAPPVFVPPPPVFTWTGFYLGVTAGYAFDQEPIHKNGFTGGGEIGYNYQFANTSYFGGTGGVVIGVEADAAYVGPGSDDSFITPGGTSVFHSRTSYVGTARGRLGYAFNNFLVYGTGGFAYGGVDNHLSVVGPAGAFSSDHNTTRTGYAYGGGIAYALPTSSFVNFFHSSAVTVKAEFIRYDLGTSGLPITGGVFFSSPRTTGNLVRAGIDYKIDFSGAPAPVVAKY